MRPQEDYLRDFAILMTDKGVVAVSDPQQIAVYDYLDHSGRRRPSDIADALGLPSSSLHFVLDKMVDSGIIMRSKPDPAKKEVYYSVLAQKIAGSAEPSPTAAEDCRRVFAHQDGKYRGVASVANMFESYAAEIGLEHGQLRSRYVRDLAAAMRDDIGAGTLESVMQAIKDRFTGLTGYRMSVYSLNPPTIIFEGDESLSPNMDMLSGLVSFMMTNATGRTLGVRSVEDFSNEETSRFKVTYDRVEEAPEPYINTSLPQLGEPERFLVLDIDGRVALLLNDIQTKLVDAIYERPLCVTDVVNMVGMPRSTVTTNLLRMVEEGVASVFYSESGALYYGLSCSILMKRVRRVSRDSTLTRAAVRSAISGNAFLEGYLQYMLASLQELGFETDYLMVVLGAKYMRVAGQDGPKNFDSYFGKMSDIAKVFGLSLSVVSVYPLTIGITKDGEGEAPAPAMTFVKGMAHQGLEMASSGIFVRVSEETPDDMRVSFKEIYPSLSMTPAAGAEADAEAEASPTKKKRTSSVREALRNRSARSDGRPVRTMRYITGIAVVLFAAVLVVFSMGGGMDNTASAETYTIDVDAEGVTLYDVTGVELEMPYIVPANGTVSFSVDLGDAEAVGMVINGKAIPLDRMYEAVDGVYTVTVDRDMDLEELRTVTVSNGLSASIYDFGDAVDASYAYNFDGYYSAVDYISSAGALWTTADAWMVLTPGENGYVSIDDDADVYLDRIVVPAWSDVSASSETLPADYVTVDLQGEYEVCGFHVEGEMKVAAGEPVTLEFVSTDGPVVLTLTEGGRESNLPMSLDRTFVLEVDADSTVSYQHTIVR